MKTLLASVAGLAALCGLTLSAEGMTEAQAVEAVGTVKGKLAGLQSDTASLTKKLSDATAGDPDPKFLSLAAKSARAEVRSLKGVLSDAGVALLEKELVGDEAKKEFSAFMLSDSDPEASIAAIERICKIIRENPGLKAGVKTPLQDTRAMSDGGQNSEQAPSAERLAELLNQTQTGRGILASARK